MGCALGLKLEAEGVKNERRSKGRGNLGLRERSEHGRAFFGAIERVLAMDSSTVPYTSTHGLNGYSFSRLVRGSIPMSQVSGCKR